MFLQLMVAELAIASLTHGSFIRELVGQPDEAPPIDESLSNDWKEYKHSFNKSYENEEEEQYRRYLWEDNLAVINKHNQEAAMGHHSYWMGVNQFTDMTIDEFSSNLLTDSNLLQSNDSLNPFDRDTPMNLPQSVDWRQKHLVTDVKNQGQCGSCWAFSATGAIEGQYAKKTGRLVSLSEQQLVDCSSRYGNKGCNGGYPVRAYQYVIIQRGLDTEQCYKYTAKVEPCRAKSSCVGATISSYKTVPLGETNLQRAVAEVGPISVVVKVSNKLMHYKSGIFVDDGTCAPNRLHAILAVGYQPSYWIIKNSWGTRWGMSGYVHWAKGRNMCGVASGASYPVV